MTDPLAFWQTFATEAPQPPPWRDAYPARLPDGRSLLLPIRRLQDGSGLASLILNQASFRVEDSLAELLTQRLQPLKADVVIGVPTLGLSLARGVAARLGHRRFAPLGTSRKFWYDPALSVPLGSITSPGAAKRLYLDPRLRPLLEGRRAVVIDDVISSGRSIQAARDLLTIIGVRPIAVAAAMLQTTRALPALLEAGLSPITVFTSPRLCETPAGWRPDPEAPQPDPMES
ncbi:MAG: phosphoribosyltransferase [Pseudomonadota bacterium]